MPEHAVEALGQGHSTLAGRLSAIQAAIGESCSAAGRDVSEVTLIPVTKFHGPELVAELIDLGLRRFAESRHPEARDKAEALAGRAELEWHFVGQIQTKKARQIAQYADAVHSIDRAGLVDALSTIEREQPLPVFVQVNMTPDVARGGVQPEELDALVEHVLRTPTLELQGLMCVAPLGEEPRASFGELRVLSQRIQALAPAATGLSMGMSNDFREAIENGATHLRIGAAITGKRPDRT
ncbi:YggS family pyridoxal phosphate-dependent enzyme [Pseudoclavibacter sp. VKM Ac-2867]|uniref:YggS family pyridoxal phosphate-dependent enzyme n=1 Tax=Pseudoclavibacter sp. VKM Ac-2867 TaxID=2783829 RepID=UPI00188B9041|nr:YggS family pyridoxal phosphate-dependent enzyme [Pseudoclavibacter sp. VKM Ac-2867]MBF4458685.1 YggS family pyridoxal phosphate-dependent enzyme [Pseudoclavibacter sp. VKM Ac-2867]